MLSSVKQVGVQTADYTDQAQALERARQGMKSAVLRCKWVDTGEGFVSINEGGIELPCWQGHCTWL